MKVGTAAGGAEKGVACYSARGEEEDCVECLRLPPTLKGSLEQEISKAKA